MNFKIDENLPAECAALLRGAGFGADTVAAERRLPFEVKAPNAATRKAMAQLAAGKGKRFTSTAALMADLNENH